MMEYKTTIDYAKFDPEVIDLCRAMNDLPGICTTDSCCGHGAQPFKIWFHADEKNNKGLFILSRSIENAYFIHGNNWNIILRSYDYPEFPLPLSFVLESKVFGKEAYEQSKAIIKNINYHLKHKEFLKLYGIEECLLKE